MTPVMRVHRKRPCDLAAVYVYVRVCWPVSAMPPVARAPPGRVGVRLAARASRWALKAAHAAASCCVCACDTQARRSVRMSAAPPAVPAALLQGAQPVGDAAVPTQRAGMKCVTKCPETVSVYAVTWPQSSSTWMASTEMPACCAVSCCLAGCPSGAIHSFEG